MKVDFAATITGLDGEAVKEGDTPATLRSIGVNALLATLASPNGQPEQLDGVTKVRHGVLAERIFKATEPLDLKAEDVALLKERIGRAYQPIAVMRAWALLEGE